MHSRTQTLTAWTMTGKEAIDFAALLDQVATKKAECRQRRKELNDVRTDAQVLQNKRFSMLRAFVFL